MNELIVKFLRSLKDDEKKKYFCVEPSEKTIGTPTPSPRSWEIVSNILDLNVNDLTLLEMISGAVGKDAAQKFIEFRSLYKGYTLEYVLCSDPGKPFAFKSITEKNFANLCLELRDLINNDFKDYNVNDIYMRVGDLIYSMLPHKNYITTVFNLVNFKDRNKLKTILELYEKQTLLDLTNKILEVLL